MTDQQQHQPIVPPTELVVQWIEEDEGGPGLARRIATRAAQWGYDQRGEVNEAELQKARDEELEACCALMDDWGLDGNDLMECRRPKPSLKELALMALEDGDTGPGASLTLTEVSIIRRALEALPE